MKFCILCSTTSRMGLRSRSPGTKTWIHEASSTYHLPAPAARLGGQSELGAAASRKAVWWDLRLASLMTHLLWPPCIADADIVFLSCGFFDLYGRPMQ